MTLDGDAIFGVVDFTGQLQAVQTIAEKLIQRAALRGAAGGYSLFGPAVLGWTSRKIDHGRLGTRARSPGAPIVIAGEVWRGTPRGSDIPKCHKELDWFVSGYANEGCQFLANLDGTFALALWEEHRECLTLLTDPAGGGQLFYRWDENRLLFSSWLQLLGGTGSEVDRQALDEFLRFLYITAPRTVYREVRRLEPGSFLTATHGEVNIRVIADGQKGKGNGFEIDSNDSTLNKFQEVFESSICRRIRSRRVGVFLSSGVDSATLLAGCQRTNPGNVRAFTVGFDVPELDETKDARTFAKSLCVPHEVLRFDKENYRRAFEQMLREFDQPFGDPASLPLICAAEAVKKQVDIIVDGTGSDGLFGAPIPRRLKFILQVTAKLSPLLRKSFRHLLTGADSLQIAFYARLFDFDDIEEPFITWSAWNKRELKELLDRPVHFEECGFYRTFRTHQSDGPQRLFDAIGIYPPDDARFEAAAIANIRMELPFRDVELGAFVRNLDQRYRFENGNCKVLLKKLFKKYYSNHNHNHHKRYFTFPLHLFLADRKFGLVLRYLSKEVLVRHGFVDPNRASRWINRYLAGDQSLLFKIWSLLCFHAWLEGHR